MNPKDKQIDLKGGQISYIVDRCLFSISVAPTKISAVEAAEFKTTIRAMAKAQEQPIYALFDIRKIKGFTKDGRDYFANDPKPMGRSAAILVGLGISRIVANFMLGMNKPPYPIKAFSNREKALNWLESQRKKIDPDYS
ncbi:hypothetical protein SapgrDRAFT_2689 [Saprospira grandis DSM 2844]|uniref:DUF7793 domain-containing protein n=1 Tax=Saprospira grandis DSM 2844 TaxID=694433 RepID=J1I6D8_9BACT|nr:STAS/SEC14 domain-containing protein [Saprospira grandis]EJF54345.1 hypothetical protein SapgrDRAFT_2689 [Saprospira grandis DSM 2844]